MSLDQVYTSPAPWSYMSNGRTVSACLFQGLSWSLNMWKQLERVKSHIQMVVLHWHYVYFKPPPRRQRHGVTFSFKPVLPLLLTSLQLVFCSCTRQTKLFSTYLFWVFVTGYDTFESQTWTDTNNKHCGPLFAYILVFISIQSLTQHILIAF